MSAPALAGGVDFDLEAAWGLNPQVALRDEEFGALAYHYGTRRLVFLKSRLLVDLVRALDAHESAAAALDAVIEPGSRDRYVAALATLVPSEIINER
jgi:putative mycofactocin binding protein MftB